MARSYRKPIATEGYGGVHRKRAKRLANKRVRMAKPDDLGTKDKAAGKRLYNTWDICDWKFELEPTKKNRSK